MDLQISGGTLLLTNGDLTLLDGIEAISQEVTSRLRFFLGEWFLNTDAGIPFFEKILVKNPSLPVIGLLLRKAVLTTPGIKSLTQDMTFTYTAATRHMAVAFRADTVSGPLTYESEFVL